MVAALLAEVVRMVVEGAEPAEAVARMEAEGPVLADQAAVPPAAVRVVAEGITKFPERLLACHDRYFGVKLLRALRVAEDL
jgi:hypothetical protein